MKESFEDFKRLIKEWLDTHPKEYGSFVEEMNRKDSAGFHSKLVQFEAKEPSIEIVENEYLDKRDDVFTM